MVVPVCLFEFKVTEVAVGWKWKLILVGSYPLLFTFFVQYIHVTSIHWCHYSSQRIRRVKSLVSNRSRCQLCQQISKSKEVSILPSKGRQAFSGRLFSFQVMFAMPTGYEQVQQEGWMNERMNEFFHPFDSKEEEEGLWGCRKSEREGSCDDGKTGFKICEARGERNPLNLWKEVRKGRVVTQRPELMLSHHEPSFTRISSFSLFNCAPYHCYPLLLKHPIRNSRPECSARSLVMKEN